MGFDPLQAYLFYDLILRISIVHVIHSYFEINFIYVMLNFYFTYLHERALYCYKS